VFYMTMVLTLGPHLAEPYLELSCLLLEEVEGEATYLGPSHFT
jgi:hypothetical protein